MDSTQDDSGSKSVAGAMLRAGDWGTKSGKYRVYSGKLLSELHDVVSAKNATAAARSSVVTALAVSPEDKAFLGSLYPEYAVVAAGFRAGLYTRFEVERQLALAWAVDRLRKYGDGVVVEGDYLLQSVVRGDAEVHVEFDRASPLAYHANFQAGHDVSRLGAAGSGHTVDGVPCAISAADFKAFTGAKAFRCCSLGTACDKRGVGAVVDLSMHPVTLKQFARGMEQADASVGYALVPYDSRMLYQEEAPWGNTGLYYRRTGEGLQFVQPDGVVAAGAIGGHTWYDWLARTRFSSASGGSYSVEITSVRGCFAFAMVTRLPEGATAGAEVRHTMELVVDAKNPKVMVVCDEAVDPLTTASGAPKWVRKTYLYDKRLYEKLYHYGLAMKREDFAATGLQALLKRAYVGDNRVTYGGGYVDVQAPLSEREAHKLVEVVFARVFVDRFDMTTLATVLKMKVAEAEVFGRATRLARVGRVMWLLAERGWRYFYDGFRSWLLKGVRALGAATGSRRLAPEVSPLVTVWDFSQANAVLARRWMSGGTTMAGGASLPYVRGATQSRVTAVWGRAMPKLPDLATGVCVREAADGETVDALIDMSETGDVVSTAAGDFLAAVEGVDDVVETVMPRFLFERNDAPVVVTPRPVPPVSYTPDPNYVNTINEVLARTFPGMEHQEFEQDAASLALDPQDRWMDPERLVVPVVDMVSRVPTAEVYMSNLRTFRTLRRIETAPELLSALTARNFSASVINEPQNMAVAVDDAFDVFLDTLCIADARRHLAEFAADPVQMETEVLREWAGKQQGERLASLARSIASDGRALEEIPLHEYSMMLKADAKPPMSAKPLREQVAPQTIMFQDKHASAMFSAVLRVLTRRFLSLLRPECLVSILKDSSGVADFVTHHAPWDDMGSLQFLENDFSKYDKSQGEFCTQLKLLAYEKLGMSGVLLDRWAVAQKVAFVRSLALGIEVTMRHQQKSGDGATTFANVLVNIVAVSNAYRGTVIDCASFIGDDSIVLTRRPAVSERSVRYMAEVFNLQSKYIVSPWMYYVSSFWKFDKDNRVVYDVPDPIKRAQRWGQAREKLVDWDTVYEGVKKDCDIYRRGGAWQGLQPAVMERYGVQSFDEVTALFNALATAVESKESFRALWESATTVVQRAS